ncbi:MAG TPA: hypothetical protein DCP90_05625 [Clostridiales bacterium]|nr:MAG: hypothetical protein A2Y22_05050 [Clostridiales bacterium GWD2_32_59]HAN10081.1 hypothetical protein [Clostridiales bacterium]
MIQKELIEKYELIADYVAENKKNYLSHWVFRRTTNERLLLKSYINYMKKTGQKEAIQIIDEGNEVDVRLKKSRLNRNKLVVDVDGKDTTITGKELYSWIQSEYKSVVNELGKTRRKALKENFKEIKKSMSYIPNRIAKTAMMAFLAGAMIQSPLVSGENTEALDGTNKNVKTPIIEKVNKNEVESETKREIVKTSVKLSEIRLTDEMKTKLGPDKVELVMKAMNDADKIEKVTQAFLEQGFIKGEDETRWLNSAIMTRYMLESSAGTNPKIMNRDVSKLTVNDPVGPFQLIGEWVIKDLYQLYGGTGRITLDQKWEYVKKHLKEDLKDEIQIPPSGKFTDTVNDPKNAMVIAAAKLINTRVWVENEIREGKHDARIKEIEKKYPEMCKTNSNFAKGIIVSTRFNGSGIGENEAYFDNTLLIEGELIKAQEKEEVVEYDVNDKNGIFEKLGRGLMKTIGVSSKEEIDVEKENKELAALSDEEFSKRITPITERKASINEIRDEIEEARKILDNEEQGGIETGHDNQPSLEQGDLIV